MHTNLFPQVDMLRVSKNSRKQREILTGFIPSIDLSGIDKQRIGEIDTFYSLCQRQRDYYRDPYDKLRKISFFDSYQKKFASRPDPTTEYLKQPVRFVVEKKPVIYPLKPEDYTYKKIPEPIDLSGTYDILPCFRYKR